LRFIELQSALSERFHLKQSCHDSRRVSDFSVKRKPLPDPIGSCLL
jgi:hypothetical protein